jgi:death on curing protein
LTLADAFMAHDAALLFGGRDGVSSLHLIESALARPYLGYHRTIASKAAAALHSLVNNHGFVDGNKRTAWLLTELLLSRSGYMLHIPDDERVDDLVVSVARNETNFDQLVDWFTPRIARA